MLKLKSLITIPVVMLVIATQAQAVLPIDLYSKEQRAKTFQACAQVFPNAKAIDFSQMKGWSPLGLCADEFAVVYSARTKTPLLVVEKQNRMMVEKGKAVGRKDDFYPDPRLKKEERAELSDYKGSGYDRGHLFAAAQASTEISMLQSFSLSGMVPQAEQHNRKTWNKLEQDTRKYIQRAKGDVFVYTGVLFADASNPKTIGKGQVWVPSHLYKLVYDQATNKAWAHIVENTDQAKLSAPLNYAEFKKKTGMDLLAMGGVRL